MSIRMSAEEIRLHQLKVHGKAKNRNTDSHADVEPDAGDAPLGAQKVPLFSSPVCVLVTHHRKRLVDTGGASEKWAMDAIVRAGVLKDDSAKYIEDIRHKQIKVKKGEQEKTVFEIEVI